MDKIIENFFNMSVLNQSMKWLMSGLGYTAILTLIAMITSLLVGLLPHWQGYQSGGGCGP